MFTITIENLLRFHEYFDNNIISIKNFPLDFEKGSIYSYILWLLCTNVERHGREKPWGGGGLPYKMGRDARREISN